MFITIFLNENPPIHEVISKNMVEPDES